MVQPGALCPAHPASLRVHSFWPCRSTATSRRGCPAHAASTAHSRTKADVLDLVQASIRAKVQFAKIRPELTSAGSCDIRASYDIAAGEALISVPAGACLRVHAGDAPPGGCLPSQAWAALPWQSRLAVKLLHEGQQGKASPFAAYLACLPPSVDAPAVWTDADLEQLRYPDIQAAAETQQRQARELHAQLAEQPAFQGVTLQQVERALMLVRSRTFAAPYLPVPLSAALPATAVLQVLVGAAAFTAGSTIAGGLEVLGLLGIGAAVAALLQQAGSNSMRMGMSDSSEEGQHVMAPMMDLINHSSAVEASCQYDPWADEFKLVASQSYAASQEVLINYGELDSDSLLLLYGFVEPNNPFERYRLPGLLDRVAAARTADGGRSEGQQHADAVQQVKAQLHKAGLEGTLDEVLLTKQGPPAITMSALQLLLGAAVSGGNSSTAHGNNNNDSAQALLMEACSSELRRLGESQEDDLELLAGIHRLPSAMAELSQVEQQLLSLEQELRNAQARVKPALQQAAEADEHVAVLVTAGHASSAAAEENSSSRTADHNGNSSPRTSGVPGGSQHENDTSAAAAAVEELNVNISALQVQRQSLCTESTHLERLTAGVKELAVHFRIQKRMFLQSYMNGCS